MTNWLKSALERFINWRSQPRKTVVIDFDGVLHAYSFGWQGGKCYDIPVPGSQEACRALLRRYNVIVCTARYRLEPAREWLERNGFPYMEITNVKPPASLYIDDNALRFRGDWKATLRQAEGILED